MICPICKSEYRRGVTQCSDCGVSLVDALEPSAMELQQQEEKLRDALVEQLRDVPLLVSGYSGRDASPMAALREAYSRPGTGSVYWCGFGDEDIPDEVRHLIITARENGRGAYYVPSRGFDDLMLRIALHCLEGSAVREARELLAAQVPTPTEESVDFTLTELPTCGIIKSNAFPFTPTDPRRRCGSTSTTPPRGGRSLLLRSKRRMRSARSTISELHSLTVSPTR